LDPESFGRVKVVYSAFVQKWISRNLDHTFPISPGIKKEMIEFYNCKDEKTTLIPNSVDFQYVKNRISQIESIMDSTIFNIIAVGRLSYQKGYDILLDAINLVSKEKDIQLHILGIGPEKSNIQKIIKQYKLNDIVSLYGFVHNPWSMIASSDLFVLPSRYEGFGNVLLEAMVCKTPIISTRAPYGPEYILDNGKYGDLVDVGDYKALADAIVNSINNIDAYKIRAESAYIRAIEFDSKLLAKRFADNLEKIQILQPLK
jgi:glycosyltransferase involved in cell wall biosynthesis